MSKVVDLSYPSYECTPLTGVSAFIVTSLRCLIRNLHAKKGMDMIVNARSSTGYQVEITSGRHQFIADESGDAGDDAGPDPYGYLLAALGACKVMTVQMYARRKEWPLEGTEVKLTTHKIHARDCEDCVSDPNARVDIIEAELTFHGDLTPEQVIRLAQIADRCPVHRTLTSETKIRSEVML
jgi:uncharacterized OsmC-like protein